MRGRKRWAVSLVTVALAIPTAQPVVTGLAADADAAAVGALPEFPPGVDVFSGLGAWVDMYDAAPWRYPKRSVQRMSEKGVRTLYLETANYRKPKSGSIYRPAAVAKFLTAADEAEIHVVAWYVPGFKNVRRDFRRSRAAIDFQTEEGIGFDSFALDIEATLVSDIETRNRRARRLSRRIRELVGDEAPLGAIVPEADALYWPGFPYRGLANIYDVFLPMAYFSYRTSGARGVHSYVTRNIAVTRQETGKPIHLIGGIAEDATAREVAAMVQAARDSDAFGASLYDFPTTTPRQWEKLAKVP